MFEILSCCDHYFVNIEENAPPLKLLWLTQTHTHRERWRERESDPLIIEQKTIITTSETTNVVQV